MRGQRPGGAHPGGQRGGAGLVLADLPALRDHRGQLRPADLRRAIRVRIQCQVRAGVRFHRLAGQVRGPLLGVHPVRPGRQHRPPPRLLIVEGVGCPGGPGH